MEFKKITIENFLSYYGKNEIEFAETTTIFIGQNNTGKSKLFDAVNFCIYGRVYETQKKEWLTNEKDISLLVLNNKKKLDSLLEEKNSIKVAVSLLIDDVRNPNIYLEIERSYVFKLVNGKYEYSSKNLVLSEIDKLDGKTNSFVGSEAEDRIKLYFSNSIKDFFLFQGEAASKIMQLQKGGNFRLAVREIARLELFEKAEKYAEKYADTVNHSIQIKQGKSKKAKSEQERLQNEIDRKVELKEEYESKRDEASASLAKYKEVLEDNEKELAKYKEFEEFFKNKNQLEQNRKQIKNEIEQIDKEKSSIAVDSAFYKVREKLNSFRNFYSSLEKKGEVPPSIPQFEIRKALDCCRCTICNSDLSEGTEGRKFAENRLSKGDTDKLGDYLRDLNYVVGDMSDFIKKVPENLKSLLERKHNNDIKRQNLIKDEENLNQMLSQINLDEKASAENLAKIESVKKNVARYSQFAKTAEVELHRAEGSIRAIENEIFKFKKELESLVIEDDEIEDEDKIKLKYSSKLNEVMKKLFEVANKTAYEQVEEKANEYYKEMTNENAALVGDIKIDLETSEIYTVDENGIRILNINQGNIISIQLAVIAGILTVAQEQFGIQYPFITDAPVSDLGGDNKISTIETMVNAFEQAVIIIKDDVSTKNKADDEIRKFIKDSDDIEIAYELTLSEADKIGEQYTVVKRIKG